MNRAPADAAVQARLLGTRILGMCEAADVSPGPLLALALLDAAATVAVTGAADPGCESAERFGMLASKLYEFYTELLARHLSAKRDA